MSGPYCAASMTRGRAISGRQRGRSGALRRRRGRRLDTRRCVGLAHEKDRNRCRTKNPFRVAAEHDPADAGPAVRAQNNQVGGPASCLGADEIVEATLQAVLQDGVDIDAGAAHAGRGLQKHLRTGFVEFRPHVAGKAPVAVGRQDERQLVDRVQQPQAAVRELGQVDRFFEAEVGRGTAIDRNKNLAVHVHHS